jgi:hypothetical protein
MLKVAFVTCTGAHSFNKCTEVKPRVPGIETASEARASGLRDDMLLERVELGPATEDEMIAAFLRAEIDASRYDEYISNPLTKMGFTRRLIDQPNLANASENRARKTLLNYRGYSQRKLLFDGFPFDATWRRVRLDQHDLRALRYANHKTWNELSDGKRLVSVGALNFPQRPDNPETYQINGIAAAVRKGIRFPELIAAQDNDGALILIEGHSRATAYLIEGCATVEALVASSQSMQEWIFY